jgi:hypothetical protein
MTSTTLRGRRTLALAAVTAGVIGLGLALLLSARTGPSRAGAADHLDAPGLTPPGGDVRLDITDLYAFRSRAGRSVFVMNVNGFSKAGQQATFAAGIPAVASTRRVTYNFRVDNDGDAKEDVVLAVRFGRPTSASVQTLQVRRNGTLLASGRTSPFGKVVVNAGGGARVYAGMRDDPFFFDLDGFLGILDPSKSFLGCKGTRPDKFAGSNVSSIVVELPSRLLTRPGSSMVGVWATTNRGAAQVDRMGRPAIATVFIPSNPFEKDEPSLKNTYNKSKPANDQARFRSEVVDTLTTLFSLNDTAGDNPADDKSKIDGLADVLLPDILTFDAAKSAGFLNGRRLADDVIDAELGLVTEGAATTDCVGRNDRAFPSAFPYLGRPH